MGRNYLFLAIIFVLLLSLTAANASYSVKVSSAVTEALQEGEKVPIVIKTKPGVDLNSILSPGGFRIQSAAAITLSETEIEQKYEVPEINAIYGKLTEASIEKLRNNPNVFSIEYSPPLHTMLQDSTLQMNASGVWAKQISGTNLTGAGESICVIDTGVNYSHPSLGGCSNDTFLAGNCQKVLSGFDYCADDTLCQTGVYDSDPIDKDGHGTHVAGIAAANGSISGIAPGATIIAMKVCNSTGSCPTGAISKAIVWCTQNASLYNISAITISLGSDTLYTSACDAQSTETSAVNNATAQNITVTIATGNNGNITGISAPACIENATSVGAVKEDDSFVYNRNSITDIVAVGWGVNSTCIPGDFGYNNGYCNKQGTSMATPHVAGAVAILQQARKLQLSQPFTKNNLVNTLTGYGDNINDSSGSNLIFPRLNVYRSVDSLTTPNYTWISQPNLTQANQNVTINITASDLFLGVQNATLTINNTEILMNQSGNVFYYIYTAPNNGSIEYNITIRDSSTSNTTESIILEVGDSTSPTYANQSSLSQAYSNPNKINITWTDNFNVSEVWVELNSINYSTGNITNTSEIYFFNFTGAVGTYNLTWHSNDTAGNSNNTGQQTLTITQADPTLNLTVKANNTLFSGNAFTENGTDANITVTSSAEGLIQIYLNNSLINNGTAPRSNLTDLENGVYNITAIYVSTQNYTAASSTLTLTVEDASTPPRAYKVSPADNNHTNLQNIPFQINATNTNLKNTTLYIYNLSNDIIYSNTTAISGTFNETNWTYNLSEGNYTWIAIVYDLSNELNWTDDSNSTIVIDRTNPTADVDVADTTITTDGTTNVSCTGSDTKHLNLVALYIEDDLKASTSSATITSHVYDPSSTGSKVASCKVYDKAGNFAENNQTITVSSAGGGGSSGGSSDSSSSSSSGGGGPTSSEGFEKTTYDFDKVTAGNYATVRASTKTLEATGVSKVTALIGKTSTSFEISVGKAQTVSTPLTSGDKVFNYIEIDHSNLENEDIDKVTIDFEVEKKWLEDNNLNKETVVMQRYSNEEWTSIETKKLAETSDKIKYLATSPGLSLFAITAKEIETTTVGEDTPEDQEEEMSNTQKLILYILGGLAILALIALILLNKYRK